MMAYIGSGQQHPRAGQPLEIGKILWSTGSGVVMRLPHLFLICGPTIMLSTLLFDFVTGYDLDWVETGLVALGPPYWLWVAVDTMLTAIVVCLVTHITHATYRRQSMQWITYLRQLPGTIVPQTIVVLIAVVPAALTEYVPYATAYLASIALTLFLLAVSVFLLVVSQVIVLEGLGLRSFKRGVQLTSGYRWSIAALVIALYIIMAVVLVFVALILDLLTSPTIYTSWVLPASTHGPEALLAILSTLTYLRLRDLKEGKSPQDLAEVFA